MSKSDLLIPISTAKVVEVPKPRELLIEVPQSDLWIGSSSEMWQHMVEPWIGDSSSEWPTTTRAWIGTDAGTWRQWYPNEAATTTVKLLMVERCNNGEADVDAHRHYWVGDWPVQSYPTPTASDADWGTRKTIPYPGNESDAVLHGMDWNPFSQVLCAMVGDVSTSNYYMYRSTDYGETWSAPQNITGVSGTGWNQASGAFYPTIPDLGGGWDEAYGVGDCLRFVGQNRWVMHYSEGGVYMFSDDDGETWTSPGGGSDDGTASKARVWYGTQWLTFASYYMNNMDTNWQYHATDGPWRSLITSPPTSRTVAFGGDAPFVCRTSAVGANQWNMSVEWFTQFAGETGQGFGEPPWVASGDQALLVSGDPSGWTCVPGTSTNWLYTGDGFAGVEMVGIVPLATFRPGTATKAVGTKAYMVSPTFQANVYDGWSYGDAPDADAINNGRVRALPHPTTAGEWRAWFINGQTGNNYAPTICYSDDQGTTWSTQADYSLGGGSMAEWLGRGQHPFFWPGYGTLGGAPLKWTFPFRQVTDIVFHPNDPLTVLSIGLVNATGVGWCMAPSYDGGQTWADLIPFTPSTSGGPATAWGRLIPLYTATGLASGAQLREAATAPVIVYAPEVLTGDQTAAVTASLIVHAPAVTAAVGGPQRVVTAAPMVAHAPAVTTTPSFVRVGVAAQIAHAPEVYSAPFAVQVGTASQLAHAPAVTTSAPPSIVQYRTAQWAMVVHAPAVTTAADQSPAVSVALAVAHAPAVSADTSKRAAGPAPAIVHAPAATASKAGAATVGAASAVIHAPAVTTAYDQSTTVGAAVAVSHAPTATASGASDESTGPIAGSPIGGGPIGG